MARAVPFTAMAASTEEPVLTEKSMVLQEELSGEQDFLPLTPAEEGPTETSATEPEELPINVEIEASYSVETGEPEPFPTEDSMQEEAAVLKEAPMDDLRRLAKAAEGTLEITTAERLLDGVPAGSTLFAGQ